MWLNTMDNYASSTNATAKCSVQFLDSLVQNVYKLDIAKSYERRRVNKPCGAFTR